MYSNDLRTSVTSGHGSCSRSVSSVGTTLPPTCLRRASDVHVGSNFILSRHTQDGAKGFSIEQRDAFVPLNHGREKRLHHGQSSPFAGQHVDDRAPVLVIGSHHHHAPSTRAIERLDHSFATDVEHELI
jgi:hypothetical protein